MRRRKTLEAFFTRGRFDHDRAPWRKRFAQDDPVGLIVVNHQHPDTVKIERRSIWMPCGKIERLQLKLGGEGKGAAATGLAFELDPAAHQSHQPIDYRE